MNLFRSLSLVGVLAGVAYISFLFQDTLTTRQTEFQRAWEVLDGRLASWRHNAELLRFASTSSRLGSYYTSADTFETTPLAGGCRIVPSALHGAEGFAFEERFVIYASPDACARHDYLLRVAPQLAAAPFMTFITRTQEIVLRVFSISFGGVVIAAPPEPFPRKSFDALHAGARNRPWYQLTESHEAELLSGAVLMTGPYRDVSGKDDILTLTTGIDKAGQLTGLINIDLKLAALSASLPGHSTRVMHTRELDALDKPVMKRKLSDSAWLVEDDTLLCRLRSLWQHRSLELSFFAMVILLFLTLLNSRLSRDNNALRQLSTTDPLTGLLNRAGLNQLLRDPEWGDWVSVVMLDLDNFKQINDNWGHPAGDQVLRVFGRCLADNIRDADVAVRVGGEEFMLILSSSQPDAHGQIIERIRKTMEKTAVGWQADYIGVTVSGGAVTVAGAKLGGNLDSIMAEADTRLYQAKRTGKNRIVSESSESVDGSSAVL